MILCRVLSKAVVVLAYSNDLRVRVLDAVSAGLSGRQAAARCRVGIATVIRWAAHAATTGETKARRQGVLDA